MKTEKVDSYLAALNTKLHGTREKARGTVSSYIETSKRFLSSLEHDTIEASDIDYYIGKRRAEGISERTLRKEMCALKMLWIVNADKPWPFTTYDMPAPGRDDEPNKTFFTYTEIEQLIASQSVLKREERFYLAVSTTWASRRGALAEILKRDYDDDTFLIRGVHRSKPVKHLIPEILKPVFRECWSGQHSTGALSDMFKRILYKAGLSKPAGYSWHSIRRTLDNEIPPLLVFTNAQGQNKAMPWLWAESCGWSRSRKGEAFMGSAMMGEYSNYAAGNDDPYIVDRLIYSVHPFLKIWERALSEPAVLPVIAIPDLSEVVKDDTPPIIADIKQTEASPLDSLRARLELKSH